MGRASHLVLALAILLGSGCILFAVLPGHPENNRRPFDGIPHPSQLPPLDGHASHDVHVTLPARSPVTRLNLSAGQLLERAETELLELELVLDSVEGVHSSNSTQSIGGALPMRGRAAGAAPFVLKQSLAHTVAACKNPLVTRVDVWSCDWLSDRGVDDPQYTNAMRDVCSSGERGRRSRFTVQLDCAYVKNYLFVFDSQGWTERAVVTRVSPESKGTSRITAAGIRNLAESMNEHTEAALLTFSIGSILPENTSAPDLMDSAVFPDDFPRMVHFHILEDLPSTTKITMSSSFAMIRMVLLSRARCVVALPAYSIVGQRIDTLFKRAAAHSTQLYVHFEYPLTFRTLSLPQFCCLESISTPMRCANFSNQPSRSPTVTACVRASNVRLTRRVPTRYPFPIVPKFNMAHEHPTATVRQRRAIIRLFALTNRPPQLSY